MNQNDLCIATITLVRDKMEEELLCTSLEQLAMTGLTVHITDGGSNPAFTDFLQKFPNFVISPEKFKGVWAQAKNSLQQAYKTGRPFVFYTEPDKQLFFQNGLPCMLEEVITNEQSGIVMASRSAAAFATFPAFQQMTESTINNCCKEIIGNPVDYTYGPFLLNSHLIPYLETVQDDIGWGWRPFAFALARRLGYRVDAFTGEFFCPPAQQPDSLAERMYRMRQLNENIEGLLQGAIAVPDNLTIPASPTG